MAQEHIQNSIEAIQKDIADIKSDIRMYTSHMEDKSIHERSPCEFAREVQKDMNRTFLGAAVAGMLLSLGAAATVVWTYIRSHS